MIKNDKWIKAESAKGLIAPFEPSLVREVAYDPDPFGLNYAPTQPPRRKVISYGLSSYGYDIRLSTTDFRVFRHIPSTIIDPKNFSENNLESSQLHSDANGSYFILPAHSYALGVAVEKLKVPNNVTVLCIGKSTYARCGVIANLTPAEAGWRGHLTLEFSNSSSADCRLYANEGIVQLLFFEGEECEVSYEARKGKYQDQGKAVTIARV